MTAAEIFNQSNGDVTKAYYERLSQLGPIGRVAVCLFRAQKRSSRAKQYRRGKYRRAAYDVKSWSMSELCKELAAHSKTLNIQWGWKPDPNVAFGGNPAFVLYCDIPDIGQVSFHSPDRMPGPDYAGDWDGTHLSTERIIMLCDGVALQAKS